MNSRKANLSKKEGWGDPLLYDIRKLFDGAVDEKVKGVGSKIPHRKGQLVRNVIATENQSMDRKSQGTIN